MLNLSFFDLYVSGIFDASVRVETHDAHLVALGAPPPPEEAVLVSATHDGGEAVVGYILALPLGDIDVEREPFVVVCENRIGGTRNRGDDDRVGSLGRQGVLCLHIL
jgi:hypothetical protein